MLRDPPPSHHVSRCPLHCTTCTTHYAWYRLPCTPRTAGPNAASNPTVGRRAGTGRCAIWKSSAPVPPSRRGVVPPPVLLQAPGGARPRCPRHPPAGCGRACPARSVRAPDACTYVRASSLCCRASSSLRTMGRAARASAAPTRADSGTADSGGAGGMWRLSAASGRWGSWLVGGGSRPAAARMWAGTGRRRSAPWRGGGGLGLSATYRCIVPCLSSFCLSSQYTAVCGPRSPLLSAASTSARSIPKSTSILRSSCLHAGSSTAPRSPKVAGGLGAVPRSHLWDMTARAVRRSSGGMCSKPQTRSRAAGDSFGAGEKSKSPLIMRSYNTSISGSSKGKHPHNMAYRQTPSAHMSTRWPR
mmetsp:Transcript_5341/g.16730  ORF Transcript_5341/g.16730 Transcript_5341/m.16730 type:complete len:359 (+) Transcript_5341:164-1240(+)